MMATNKKPMQQGVESTMLDYYDIMVIGKTGMGKSTTVDKMLIARLVEEREDHSATQESEVVLNRADHKMVCDDLIMWLVSTRPSGVEKDCQDDNFEMMSLRLKNLVFFRSLENPHLEVNASRDTNMRIYKSTLECELLSNEHTKIRVLDVPGFFGREAATDVQSPADRLAKAAEYALSNMRKVLRIKNAHNLKFRRVVYFLPEQGALKRTSQTLISELEVMEKYFGRAIFDSMVVIATLSPEVFEYAPAGKVLFSARHFEQTQNHLQDALKSVFKSQDAPKPPITFLSLLDTCEDVLHKVQSAEVLKDSVDLEFRSSVCARCGLKVIEEGKDDSESSYCVHPDRKGYIAYEESTCHPAMIPKYTEVEKVLGGILHLFTFRRFVGKWPNFESMDEVCIACKKPPRSHGCMQVGTTYPGANKDGIVRHSSSAIDSYQIEINEEGEGPESSITVGAGPPPEGGESSASGQDRYQYVTQSGTFDVPQEQSMSDNKDFNIKC